MLSAPLHSLRDIFCEPATASRKIKKNVDIADNNVVKLIIWEEFK
jgi:hypothetical protein